MSIGGATYDLFVRVPHEIISTCRDTKAFTLPLGEKLRVQEVVESSGGGAANTSVGLARLGCDACFEGVVGSDQWGEQLMKNLHNEGVNTECAMIVDNEVSSFSIILNTGSGERIILYDPGTNAHLHETNFDKEYASNMDWVYLNHIQEDSCTIQDDITEILTSDADVCLTWNPGGCQIDKGLEPENNNRLAAHTDLLLLNKSEALRFTKTETIEQAIQTLLEHGVKNVCITDGKNGVTACDGKKMYRCSAVKGVHVIDTTGAGDAFGTGATWALLQGMPLPEAIKAGSINAASVVEKVGAQAGLLTHTEMQHKLKTAQLDVTEETL